MGLLERDFFAAVYEVVRLVPRGRVTSYGAIAKFLGSGRSARAVGYAMNASHQVIPAVPAHRVVNRNGLLSGKHHFGSKTTMADQLKREGIYVLDDIVQNFQEVFWDPECLLQDPPLNFKV